MDLGSIILLLIGMAIGVIIQTAYSVYQMFKEPEKHIKVAQAIIDLREYRDRGY
jgi:hypothetical protein